MSDILYSTPYQVPGSGGAVYGGGGSTSITGARDISAARSGMAKGRLPEAEYPDGYLGTFTSRRADRLSNESVRTAERNNSRPYLRGVHKGSRLVPSDYEWPVDFHPMTGIEHQRQGRRWTAQGNPENQPLHNPAKSDVSAEALDVNPLKRQELRKLLPSWK
ncbi:hypothetical protein [Streptomyces sp. UNOC14_S4]|uniref:hypothetical protein n=1 Tax=Streptomyces sp. UNOC14_S4 TaxID=2872340 RepID=UPI001E5CA530|nr:hypothetical protein [Streptomyces sp. UNOC14_S4]MCC3766012.1 hypothetical protein [Streptomyces sp. UNOC14_S4]